MRGGLLGHAVVADHRVEAPPGVGVLRGVVGLQRSRDASLVLQGATVSSESLPLTPPNGLLQALFIVTIVTVTIKRWWKGLWQWLKAASNLVDESVRAGVIVGKGFIDHQEDDAGQEGQSQDDEDGHLEEGDETHN